MNLSLHFLTVATSNPDLLSGCIHESVCAPVHLEEPRSLLYLPFANSLTLSHIVKKNCSAAQKADYLALQLTDLKHDELRVSCRSFLFPELLVGVAVIYPQFMPKHNNYDRHARKVAHLPRIQRGR